MKKVNIFIVFICIFLLLTKYSQAQEKFYYAFEEKIFLNEVADKFVVSFDKQYFLNIQENLRTNTKIKHIEFQKENNYCILTMESVYMKTERESFSKQVGIKSINPMYIIVNGGLEIGITDEIVVQFKDNASAQAINEMNKKYRIEIKENYDIFQVLAVPITFDPLEVANAYQTSGLVNFCKPNFISKMEFQYIPPDPYFVNQYYLRNTGQTVNGRSCTAGADIKVESAWDITKGNSNIVIAVIDEGVTSNHPDLPNTRQVRLNGSNFGTTPPTNDPSPTGDDNHGNACAGIIAASHNNEGIAGIAPNCKIMPIRAKGASTVATAAAIIFAKKNGADIISNSWSYRSSNGLPLSPNLYPEIVSAILDATNNGRDGKGCVVVFSAGNTANHLPGYISNDEGYIAFPANVNISGVLTVGASDRNDNQAKYSPSSNLNNSYNQIIDVVAPSHKAYSCMGNSSSETFDVWTIDIPNSNGYNPVKEKDCSSGASLPTVGSNLPNSGTNYTSYTGHFGGTSASCPQVAGVAALILSAYPNLTQLQVATIIRSTARKTTNYGMYDFSYVRSDGMWSRELGYGVLNAYAAVKEALRYQTVATCSTPTLYFNNQTVTTSQTITNCNNISVQNVTINTNKKLILDAVNETSITKDFNVPIGAELEIK